MDWEEEKKGCDENWYRLQKVEPKTQQQTFIYQGRRKRDIDMWMWEQLVNLGGNFFLYILWMPNHAQFLILHKVINGIMWFRILETPKIS